jgi:cyclopropane-fatty-acyl-phospholipid synthase
MHSGERLLSKLSRSLSRKQLPLRICLWDNNSIDFGPEPDVCVTIKSPKAALCFLNPSLDRLGKAYVEGEIDIEGPLSRVMHIAVELSGRESRRRLYSPLDAFTLRHSRRRDARSIRYHYDIANDFYALWLDRNMVYSCAYFKTGEEDIHLAQEQKLDHICRKLRLRSGEQFLDIGCGWGGLICWAAKYYGVKATGVTLSRQQYLYTKERIEKEGLCDRVEVRLQDYRDIPVEGVFDKIASIGMFEHVGLKKLPVYFGAIRRLLKENGLVLNHGITTRDPDNPIRGTYAMDHFFQKWAVSGE